MKIKTFRYVAALALLCGIGCVVFQMLFHTESGTLLDYACPIVRILTCVFGIWYLLVGCSKKRGVVLFQAYYALFALVCFLLILGYINSSVGVGTILLAVRLLALIVLASVLDLGEKKSKWITALIALLCLVSLALSEGDILGSVCDTILGCASFVMVSGKYADKKARGSN